jgi:hypothetical protein
LRIRAPPKSGIISVMTVQVLATHYFYARHD